MDLFPMTPQFTDPSMLERPFKGNPTPKPSVPESRIAEIRADLKEGYHSERHISLRAIRDLLAHIDAQDKKLNQVLYDTEYQGGVQWLLRQKDDLALKFATDLAALEAGRKQAVEALEEIKKGTCDEHGLRDIAASALKSLSALSYPETPALYDHGIRDAGKPVIQKGDPADCEQMARELVDRKDPTLWGAAGALNWAAKHIRELEASQLETTKT